jgi:hypothetical protein
MKHLIIALTLLVGLTSQAKDRAVASDEINFGRPEGAKDAVEFQIISHSNAWFGSSEYYYDSNGNYRIALTSTGEIYLYNSAKAEINKYQLSESVAQKFTLVTSKASDKCPVNIKMDRESKKLIQVSPTCDELSALPDEERRG